MRWPGGDKLAVFINIAFEGWANGKAPGISPMGNPLPAGLLDTQARSWGEYGARRGIWRLLEIMERRDLTGTVMTSAMFAETAPDAVRAIADAGHEVCAHSMSQDVLPVMLAQTEESDHIERCRKLLETASGSSPQGWISPRGTPSANTARLLADAGFTWFGDCFDDDVAYVRVYGDRPLVHLPLTMEVNDLPVVMKHGSPATALESLYREALDAYLTYRGEELMHFDVTVHAHLSGRPVGAQVFERVLDHLQAQDDIWIATRGEVANQLLDQRRGEA